MNDYTLHPKAAQDITHAFDFYEKEAGQPVAQAFLSEFQRVARLVAQVPGLGTPISKGRKTFPLRIFPYSIVYRVDSATIQILVVRHQRRRPNYGNTRR